MSGPLQRADVALAAALKTSRAEARRILERGPVELDGKTRRLRKGAMVPRGARLRAPDYRPPSEWIPTPDPDLPLEVLSRGAGWIAVDKPAGVAVHPREENERGTLLNAVVAREPEIVGVGEGGLRSGVLHRLDGLTSGVVLFATENGSFSLLRDAFSKHLLDKRYRAWVAGQIDSPRRVELPLRMAAHHPARVRVADDPGEPGARLTRLRFRPLRTLGEATELEIELETGHLHQVRVTLAHLGHPVLGDPVYGTADGAPRLMLHAASVTWPGLDVHAESPLPREFRDGQRLCAR